MSASTYLQQHPKKKSSGLTHHPSITKEMQMYVPKVIVFKATHKKPQISCTIPDSHPPPPSAAALRSRSQITCVGITISHSSGKCVR